jgi:hypothetical protein
VIRNELRLLKISSPEFKVRASNVKKRGFLPGKIYQTEVAEVCDFVSLCGKISSWLKNEPLNY